MAKQPQRQTSTVPYDLGLCKNDPEAKTAASLNLCECFSEKSARGGRALSLNILNSTSSSICRLEARAGTSPPPSSSNTPRAPHEKFSHFQKHPWAEQSACRAPRPYVSQNPWAGFTSMTARASSRCRCAPARAAGGPRPALRPMTISIASARIFRPPRSGSCGRKARWGGRWRRCRGRPR